MLYRCPVCGYTAELDDTLAKHMATTHTMPEYHQEWIESKGIELPDSTDWVHGKLGAEFHRALKEVVGRECKVEA